MRSWTSPLFALLVSACASTGSVTPIGVTLDAESPGTPAPPAEAPKEIVPDDVVERAAQDFHARREADGQTLDQRQLFDELARYDVVCLGEAHDSARDHFAELAVVEALARRARVSGRALGVGFEMFQVPFEEALRSYARGRLDDAGLRKKTQYDDRWGFPYAYYRPVLAYARAFGLSLRALNAPRELTHAVAENGLSGLTARQRKQLPELDLDNAEHRATFERLMAHHPKSPEMNLDDFYAAQVVWDETMADNAAAWVGAQAPQRQLVVLAGSAHCQREAIPARIERRVSARVTNVRLSTEHAEDSAGYAYTLVFDGQARKPEPAESRDDG